MKLIQGSFLYALILKIVQFYSYSVIGRTIELFRSSYAVSRTSAFIDRILGSPDLSTEKSRLKSFGVRFNSACARFGRAVGPAAENSVLVRFWKSGAVRNSLLYKAIFSRGTHKLIVAVFALYLPVDFILRSYVPVAGIASVWDEAFLLFGFAYAIFMRMFTPKALETRTNPLDMPILLFMGLGFMLLCVVSPYMNIAIAGYRAVVQYMLWFFVLTRVMKDDSDVQLFCWTMVGIGTAIALHGVYQFVVGVDIPETWVSQAEVGVRTRVFSIFGSPNIMGSFCVMVAPLTASFAYKLKSYSAKLLLWGCTMLICVACLVTFSRGAWLGMAVAVFVFAILRDRKLLALIALAIGVAVFIPQVANRITFLFTSEFDKANMYGGRGGRRREGLMLLSSSSPLFGFGLGRFGGAVAMQNQIDGRISYFYMDNYYLKTLVEMGYLGLVGYVMTLATYVYVSLRAIYRTRKESISMLIKGLFAGSVGVLVHCLTENIFEVPYMSAYFWGYAAVIVYVGFIRKPKVPHNQ